MPNRYAKLDSNFGSKKFSVSLMKTLCDPLSSMIAGCSFPIQDFILLINFSLFLISIFYNIINIKLLIIFVNLGLYLVCQIKVFLRNGKLQLLLQFSYVCNMFIMQIIFLSCLLAYLIIVVVLFIISVSVIYLILKSFK